MTRPPPKRPRNRGSILHKFKRFFSSPKRPEQLWGPYSLLFNRHLGRGSFALGEMWSGREASHTPFSAEVNNEWSYTSTPSIYLNGMDRKVFFENSHLLKSIAELLLPLPAILW